MASKTRRLIFGAGLPLLFFAIFMGVYMAFPHLLNRQYLVCLEYMDTKEPRVITLYQEVVNNEDNNYVAGYWIYLVNPVTGKELDKLFLKHKFNDIPSPPKLLVIDGRDIWIVGNKGMFEGENAFYANVSLINGKLVRNPVSELEGFTITGCYNNRLTLKNAYNEYSCYDLVSHALNKELCDDPPEVEDTTALYAYFFVKNTSSSTRAYLYFYQTQKRFPPPGVFAGSLSSGEPIPGWHLMDILAMQNNAISQDDLDGYAARFDKNEHATLLDKNTLFNNPYILYGDASRCVLCADGETPYSFVFYMYSSEGKLIWKTPCPSLKKTTYTNAFHAVYKEEQTLVINPEACVISINNSNGNINWKYPR